MGQPSLAVFIRRAISMVAEARTTGRDACATVENARMPTVAALRFSDPALAFG